VCSFCVHFFYFFICILCCCCLYDEIKIYIAAQPGPSRVTAGPGKHSRGPLVGKCLNFSFFKISHLLCTLYF